MSFAPQRLRAASPAHPAVPDRLDAIVNRYCTECHKGGKPKGDLLLDPFTAAQWADYDLVDEMVIQLEDGDMPPSKAKTPMPDPARQEAIAALKARLTSLDAASMPGTLNRLTRTEWSNTLEDLIGLPVEKQYELPVDSTHAMTRLGEHQILTPMAMRQYQTVAERYIDEAILTEPVEPDTYNVDLAKKENQIGNSSNESQPWGITSHNDTTVIRLKSPVKTFADEGVYEFDFDYYFAKGEPLGKNSPASKRFRETGLPPEAAENVPSRQHFGQFIAGGEIVSKGYKNDLDGEKLHPGGKAVYYRFDQPLLVRISKDIKEISFRVNGNGENKRWIIRGVKIRGPLDKSDPPTHKNIFADAKRGGDLDVCKRVLDRLAERLFRRPIDDKIMAPYYAMAAARYEAGANLYAATEACLKAMIVSPYFLFKDLPDGPKLQGRMIATRLSYLLWNSGPDERLMQLAAEGKLSDPAVRRAEAERLLADPEKSDRFVRLFTKQWLGLERFDDFAPNSAYIIDRILVPLRPSIQEQPYAFFNEVLRSDLSARNFIHSDFVVWDNQMMRYYNNDKETKVSKHRIKFKADEFVRVDLSDAPEPVRMRHGGLVSMPVIMCMTTDGETTQPFLRAAWVIKHLFGEAMDPPDTVPALEINLANVDKPKEILRLHKQDPSCYDCHIKMDYMGLALENYDVMGRYQSNYLFPIIEGKKNVLVTKDPVDSLAETRDGKKIDGVAGLKAHMFERQDEILRNLTEKLFAYAIGREVRYSDREAIDALMKSAASNDYKLRDTILDIIASDSFIQR